MGSEHIKFLTISAHNLIGDILFMGHKCIMLVRCRNPLYRPGVRSRTRWISGGVLSAADECVAWHDARAAPGKHRRLTASHCAHVSATSPAFCQTALPAPA